MNDVNLSRKRLSEMSDALGLAFDDISLLGLAFAHPSFVAEFPGVFRESNSRLEFLGDAALSLIVAEELVARFPDRPEGCLTQLRVSLVDNSSLGRMGERLGFGDWLALGRGEAEMGGRKRESNLADAFEAVLGALFVDQGYDAARDFALRVMSAELDEAGESGTSPRHPKSLLHEAAMERGLDPPRYVIVARDGPDNAPTFTAQALFDGVPLGSGRGRSKKAAGSEAARQALKALEL